MKAKQQTTSQNKQYNMWQNMIYAYRRVAKVYPMMIVFTILSIVLSVLLPVINNVLPALVVAMIEQGSIRQFLLMLAILGIVTAGGKWMLNYSNRETEQYITSFRFQTMILEFYDKVMRTGYHNVEPHQKQIDFQNAFSALNGDNWGIEQIFRKAPLFFFHLIGLIMYAGILSTIDWKILLVLFTMTVSCLIFERISYRYQQKTRKEEGEYHHATYYLGEYCSALENAKDIRLYGIENWFPQRFEQLNQKIKKLSANIWGRMKLMDVSNNLFLVVRDLLAYGILIGQVLDHTLNVAEFTFYVGMIAGFTTWLTGLVENYGYLRKASLQLGYLRNYMEMEDGKREKSGTDAPLSYPLSIEFKDVSFTYPQTEKPVLEHLNLTIRPGEKIALVGQNGTGKTTIARLISKIYKQLGVLEKGQMIEVDRAGLVAGFVGQTALKTKEKIDEAMGGILFIDEAYTLAKGSSDFGQEAIDIILKAMEDNRENFVVIVAGYPAPMEEFLKSNPGLKSRFNKSIFFDDYTQEELFSIFESFLSSHDMRLSSDATEYLRKYLKQLCTDKPENFANGREMRNLFETAVSNQANRLARLSDITDEELNEITVADFKE